MNILKNNISKFFTRYPDTMLPVIFLSLYIIFYFSVGQFIFQNIDDSILYIKGYYAVYGYLLIFIGGFLETFFMLGIYLPASLTILLGILINPYSLRHLFWVCVMCITSAFLANVFNFIIGKYGFARFFNFLGANKILTAESKKEYSNKTILFSSINPNLLGITVVYLATKGVSFYKIMSLSFISTLIWVPILASFVVVLGDSLLKESSTYLFFFLFIVWILYLVLSEKYRIFVRRS